MAKKEKSGHFGVDITSAIQDVFESELLGRVKFSLAKVESAALGQDETALSERAVKALTERESAVFHGFRHLHRKREWLAGRLAVKEAVGRLLGDPHLCGQDVEIGADENGKPFLATTCAPYKNIHLAISHSGGTALGLASFVPCALDYQEIRASLSRVETKFAGKEETALLQAFSPDRLTALGLLWAGKESLRKYFALWPLLGFLESELTGVEGQGKGFVLAFQTKPDKRDLPDKLPKVWATLFDESALAVILGQGEGQ